MSIEVGECDRCGMRWLASVLSPVRRSLLPEEEHDKVLACRRPGCGGEVKVVTRTRPRHAPAASSDQENEEMRRLRSQAATPVEPTAAPATPQQPAVAPTLPEPGAMTLALKQLGFDVTITQVESWGSIQRTAAAEAIRTRGEVVHDGLRKYHRGAGNVPGAAEQDPGLLQKAHVGGDQAAIQQVAGEAVGAVASPAPREAEPAPRPQLAIEASPAGGGAREVVGAINTPSSAAAAQFFKKSSAGEVSPDIERIVETVFRIDAMKIYEDLEQNLVIGEDRCDYRTVMAAADKAGERAERAHRLYLCAKLELEEWEIRQEPVQAALADKALETLEREKAAGERKKMITKDDVRTCMLALNRDEVVAYEQKRARLKGTVQHLERLAEIWKERCYTFAAMLGTFRK